MLVRPAPGGKVDRFALVDVDEPERGIYRRTGTKGEVDKVFDTRERHQVPRLAGTTFGAASSRLTELGLATAYDSAGLPPADAIVTGSDPGPGAPLPFGSYVTLNVRIESGSADDGSGPTPSGAGTGSQPGSSGSGSPPGSGATSAPGSDTPSPDGTDASTPSTAPPTPSPSSSDKPTPSASEPPSPDPTPSGPTSEPPSPESPSPSSETSSPPPDSPPPEASSPPPTITTTSDPPESPVA
ncbi:PASTA domain-containing protein [Streptomyces turgidiscabies]|uniref:PASTA domain-containing protein n=1 Tax=Streptomyces turgidiscabies TaxID=85558 RepID=UPI0029C0C288|nr:PASTA domain-containing protein [Streptomyces turgidiscabies]